MTSAPIIRDHPAALVTALTVTVLGVFLSIAISGSAAIVLAVLLVDWLVKSFPDLVRSLRNVKTTSPKLVDVGLTLLAIGAAGGLIGLVAWII